MRRSRGADRRRSRCTTEPRWISARCRGAYRPSIAPRRGPRALDRHEARLVLASQAEALCSFTSASACWWARRGRLLRAAHRHHDPVVHRAPGLPLPSCRGLGPASSSSRRSRAAHERLGLPRAMLVLGDLARLVIIPSPPAPRAGRQPRDAATTRPVRSSESTRRARCWPRHSSGDRAHALRVLRRHSGPIFHMVTHATDQGVAAMAAATVLGSPASPRSPAASAAGCWPTASAPSPR